MNILLWGYISWCSFTIKESYYPNEDNREIYQRLFGVYERVYWNLQNEFEEIADIQRTWKDKYSK